jgi:hypothetical protein
MGNRRRVLIGLLALLGTFVTAAPGLAHHSFALFEMQKSVTIHGVVKDFQWTSPHSWLDVMVLTATGDAELWALECGAPGALARAGWTKSSLKPGDKVTVELHPLRSGGPGGSLFAVTTADGHRLEFGERKPGGVATPATQDEGNKKPEPGAKAGD